MAKIKGSNGDDKLKGTKFKDVILGKDGDDTIKGKGNDDKLFGGADNDALLGDKGNDQLDGAGGDDNLVGGAGKDLLDGGFGNDKLTGGNGNDELKGGSGDDDFFFKFSQASGRDFIDDFHPGEDQLHISKKFGFDTVQDVLDAAETSNGVTSIDLSGSGDENLQIILLGITNASQILTKDVVLIA